MAIRIERLSETHDCKQFKCGHNYLEQFLRKRALANDGADLGRTYVAVEDGQYTVVGYYTVTATSVAAQNLPDGESLHYKSIGVILIGMLGVAKAMKRQGMGRRLLMHAFKVADEVAERCGAYAIVVDSLPTEEALGFYGKLGFKNLTNAQNERQVPLFILLRTVREALAAAAKSLAAANNAPTPSAEASPPEIPPRVQ